MVILTIYTSPVQNSVKSFMTHGNKEKVVNIGSGRRQFIGVSFKIFKENPIVGVGLSKYNKAIIDSVISKKSYTRFKISDFKKTYGKQLSIYPHNIILEVISELGAIGLFLFIMLFYPFKHLFNRKNRFTYLTLMGFLYACTSFDLGTNMELFMFNTMLLLTSNKFTDIPDSSHL